MNGPDAQLLAEIEALDEAGEDQLLEILGTRASAMALDPAVAGSYSPSVTADVDEMGGVDWLKRLGARIFKRLNREAHDLLCGQSAETAEDRQKIREALGSKTTAAALLAGLLVTHVGVAPAVAAVVATLIMKRFLRPVYEETCAQWGESLDDEE